MPPTMADTLSERIFGLMDVCHKRFRQWQYQNSLITTFVTKARRKERDANAGGHEEPKLYLQEAVLQRKLSEYDLRTFVELAQGLDHNEWLASHTVAFFEHVNLLYGTVSEFCIPSLCPEMVGPGLRHYQWVDERGKKIRLSAPQYVDYVMTFVQRTVQDETIFPTKYALSFPVSFESVVRRILTLLFHVLAHIYHSHFNEIFLLGLHSHLHCVFAHFFVFVTHFQLVDESELNVLGDLVSALQLCHPEPDSPTVDPPSDCL